MRKKPRERGHTLDLLRTEQFIFSLSLFFLLTNETRNNYMMWPRLTHKYRKKRGKQRKAIRKEKERKKEGDVSSSSSSSHSTYIAMPAFTMPVLLFLSKRIISDVFFLNTYTWVCACVP